jgi:hypothetical protein
LMRDFDAEPINIILAYDKIDVKVGWYVEGIQEQDHKKVKFMVTPNYAYKLEEK